jgi:DNA-binding XRE family transcriptional regulator/tetratricopeptide (TPR) repeat protein
VAESFGSRLRRHRLAAGLTQEELAERAALSPTAIAALERGRNRTPRMSTLRQLARALDLTTEETADLSRAASADRLAPAPASDRAVPDPPHEPGVVHAGATVAPPPGGPVSGFAGGGTARSSVAVRRWRAGFVGRTAEIGYLQDVWRKGGRLAEVMGESGIGKTRLVAELAGSLPEGTTVLWGRCSQDRLGSYLPYVEILRHLAALSDDSTLRAAVGARGELTRLIPELVDRVGPLPAPVRAEAGSEQRMLFESVAAFFAPWTPMVVVIDDLHWADDATLALLAYLVRENSLDGLVTVVTARPSDLDPMTSALVAELGREADFARIDLRGLDGDDLASLVSDLVGAPAPADLVKSVADATEGNPFFAEEMTLHLVDAGMLIDTDHGIALAPDADQAGVPQRVRDTVVRRLMSLTADGMELLSVGAVIGREFELSVGGAASGLVGARLVDASDDTLLSGIVVETGPGRLTFSHAVLRDAVSSRLSFARRADIHRRVASVIEDRWPSTPSVAAELARHWGAVAEVDPSASTQAATWAVRAGDIALASAAADEAIARYEQASALWASASAGHADALIRLGLALQHRGRADDADVRFRQAEQLAMALRDPTLQARAAIGLGRRYPYWETDRARIATLEGALAALPSDERLLRVMLMGLLVTHLITGFEPEQAHRRDALADELSAVAADATTGPDLLLAIGHTRIYDCIEDPATLVHVADRLLDVAQVHSDLRVEAGARYAHALSYLDLGEMELLVSSSDLYSEVSDRLDDPRDRSQAAMVRSTIAFTRGHYEEAAERSDEALELGRASGDFNAELLHYAQGLLRAVDQGLAGVVLPLLVEATDYQQIAGFAAGTALAAALAGDRDRARSGLLGLVASGFQGSPRGADFFAPAAFLAHTSRLLGEVSAVEVLYGWLSRSRARVVRVGPLAGWWGPLDHHLGCLAGLMGRYDEAEQRLRNALALERAIGARPFEARTLAELARVLRLAGRGGASRVAHEAVVMSKLVGAAGIEAEVESACDSES